jgi:WS/DGAT/MGAT family acyltransferase
MPQSVSGRQPLSLIELSPFLQERAGWPPDIGALAVLEGAEPAGAWDEPLTEVVLQRVQRWTEAFPRAAQLVHRPALGLKRPFWYTTPRLDIRDQINVLTVPAPGDERTLLDVCAGLHVRPFDVTRPLWRLWLLDGLTEGRLAMLIRLHHALADGATALDSLTRLFEPDGTSPGDSRMPRPNERPPAAGRRPANAERRIMGPLTRFRRTVRQLSGMLRDPAPRTSLNRRVGRYRRFAVLRYDVNPIRQVAHSFGVTINDVVLTAVAGGLHRLLIARGETTAGTTLRAMVPIAGPVAPGSSQNATTEMLVRLPVGEIEPQRRLEMIAADTRLRKNEPVDFAASGFLRSRLLMTLGTRLAAFQRLANIYVANLRGPAGPLYLGPMSVSYVAPLVPLAGNLPLSVGVLSCSGVVTITVITDPVACGDVELFLDGMRGSLQDLSLTALA